MTISITDRRSFIVGLGACVLSTINSSALAGNNHTRKNYLHAVGKMQRGKARDIARWLAENAGRAEHTREYDYKGYAPQYRLNGDLDNMGICAHFDDDVGLWFLESAFSKSETARRGISPSKFISWIHPRIPGDGTWGRRRHNVGPTNPFTSTPLWDTHKNFPPTRKSNREGRELVAQLHAAMYD